MPPDRDPHDLLTRTEAAAYLRTSESQIKRMVDRGDLRERFADGRPLYQFQDILDAVEHRTRAAEGHGPPAIDPLDEMAEADSGPKIPDENEDADDG